MHEKEAYALVDALKHWRHYLLGAEVQVHTDNSVLSYLLRTQKPSSRQMRWLETLQEYTLHIRHIPGKANTAADALSRVIPEIISCKTPPTLIQYATTPIGEGGANCLERTKPGLTP